MFERFTEQAIKVVMLAQEEARRMGHDTVGTEHILVGLVGAAGIAGVVLKQAGLTVRDAKAELEKLSPRGGGFSRPDIPFTPRAKRLLELSLEQARRLGHSYIGVEHILMALLVDKTTKGYRILESKKIKPADIEAAVMRLLNEGNAPSAAGVGARGSKSTPKLEEFGTDLTEAARNGKLDPVVGRHKEIERMIQILGRRTKNNPVLIGEPGVGKTALVEGLAQRIVNNDVPDLLEGKRVIQLDMGGIIAGTRYRGEFEERMKAIMDEVIRNGNVVLVIDEIHTIVGAGNAEGAIDAANILKPALARGQLQCVGSTTLDEYRKHIERDAALERRFQPVMVGEPSVPEAIEILYGLRDRYEAHHKIKITDDAIEAAVRFSDRYISDRYLPDKAIDLVDEAGSRLNLSRSSSDPRARELKKELETLKREKDDAVRSNDFASAKSIREREVTVEGQIAALLQATGKAGADTVPVMTEEDIAEIVSSWTGIPVQKVSETQAQQLLELEGALHRRLIGQEEAVKAVSRAIRRNRVGLGSANRPVASFIFSGPTGVGKTELTKALAEILFGSEDAMVRLDMSEYMESHTVSKLIGSPPGYVGYGDGGQLTEAVRRRPYTVVLFDEIEKAHPDVFNMMLQILEDGRLTDSQGRVVNFCNTIIVMTSNVGSKVIERSGGGGLGFEVSGSSTEQAQYERIQSLVFGELKQYFRPEFLNRVDETIVFRMLNRVEVREIAEIMVEDVTKRLEERNIALSTTSAFLDHAAEIGFNPVYGARPLRRAIMTLLEDRFAEEILSGKVKDGDSVVVDYDGQQVTLSVQNDAV